MSPHLSTWSVEWREEYRARKDREATAGLRLRLLLSSIDTVGEVVDETKEPNTEKP